VPNALSIIEDSMANDTKYKSGPDAKRLREARLTAYAVAGAKSREWLGFKEFSRTEMPNEPRFATLYLFGIYGWPKLLENDGHVRSRVGEDDYFVHVGAIAKFMENYRMYMAKIRPEPSTK
jgi:hypothetical protein